MPDKNTLTLLLGMAAIIVTLGVGTCSTNARIDNGFTSVNLRIDDTNRRMDDGFNNLQRQIDDTNRRMNDGFNNVSQRIDDTNRRIDDTNQRDRRSPERRARDTLHALRHTEDPPPAD